MADDDFDIDIYGDANEEQGIFEKPSKQEDEKVKHEEVQDSNVEDTSAQADTNGHDQQDNLDYSHEDYPDPKTESGKPIKEEGQQQIKSTDDSSQGLLTIPKQAPQQQGVKRKEGSDDRPIDPGATSAILISDLHWWNTDDDVRGWVNQAQCEDELKDITFSEHKVNGKSKGQAYLEFTSQQAATAAKHKIDAFGDGQEYVKKHAVTYSNPNINPFKTLPKDAPPRAGKDGSTRGMSSSYNDRPNGGNFNNNFRGRGNYGGGRGNVNNMNNGGFNRNFSNPSTNNNRGAFQPPMGGFQGNQMAGGFGSFTGGMMNGMRGGGAGMRGGRGGMNGMGNAMMGMPMGGMPMGNMGSMPSMAASMGMGNMGGPMPGMMSSEQYCHYLASIINAPRSRVSNHAGKRQAVQHFVPTSYQRQSFSPSSSHPSKVEGGESSSLKHIHSFSDSPSHLQPEAEQRRPNTGAGFQNMQPHFNPAFFQQQNQMAGNDWQNPHGAKRPRPE